MWLCSFIVEEYKDRGEYGGSSLPWPYGKRWEERGKGRTKEGKRRGKKRESKRVGRGQTAPLIVGWATWLLPGNCEAGQTGL